MTIGVKGKITFSMVDVALDRVRYGRCYWSKATVVTFEPVGGVRRRYIPSF